jgi:1-deoxy-D-xylulose-5-phosphate synthase
MPGPTGVYRFGEAYPGRMFDVGIAEQHAVTSAAGLALGGVHPVVAIYATFLNRAFDQLLMDVALHRCGVTFVLDRAGITGDDGPSHNGMWDMSILGVVPRLRLAAPRDAVTLREELREAVAVEDAPTVLRYPKGVVPADIPAVARVGEVDVLRRGDDDDVLLVAVGGMAETCLEVATRCADQGVGVTVVDPRWVRPVSEALVGLARSYKLVVVVEDNSRAGGIGSAIDTALRDARVGAAVRTFGIPARFLDHGKRPEVLAEVGLTAQELSRQVVEAASHLGDPDRQLADPGRAL